MTQTTTVPRAARRIHDDWVRLAADTPDPGLFDPSSVDDLPEPARRWLTHAIQPGVPLSNAVRLTMHGRIRIGAWRSFQADQILATEGFIWAATTRIAGVPVTGYDRYTAGSGQMRWRLLGAIPVMSVQGPDVTRSAAGRLASELVMTPTAFRAATWTVGDSLDTALASRRIGEHTEQVEVQIGADGRVLQAMVQRWGNPLGSPFARYPFGVAVEEEATFGGVTIPSVVRAGWFWGTDRQDEGEFFQATITDAEFR